MLPRRTQSIPKAELLKAPRRSSHYAIRFTGESLLENLTLGSAGITDNTNVDVTTEFSAFLRVLRNTSKEHE